MSLAGLILFSLIIFGALAEERVFFEESPALPLPTSYADIYQTGRNVSKINGRYTDINYRYASKRQADMMKIASSYASSLTDDGYTIKNETEDSFDIYLQEKKLAHVEKRASQITVEVEPGNEKLKPPAAVAPTAEAETQASEDEGEDFSAVAPAYFEESPALPVPTSYADDVYQSGRNVSKRNKKYTEITYRYTSRASRDMMEFASAYATALRARGYTIDHKTEDSFDVFLGKKKLVHVEKRAASLTFEVEPGNEKLKPPAEPAPVTPAPAAAEEQPAEQQADDPQNAAYAFGTPAGFEFGEFNFAGLQFVSDRITYHHHGSKYSYYEPKSGNRLFCLEGTFKNTSADPVILDNAFGVVEFDGTYRYPAELVGKETSGTYLSQTVAAPFEEYDCYLYADVPQELLNQYSTCKVSIGFARGIGATVVSDGLPDLSFCDAVLELTLPSKGSAPAASASVAAEHHVKITGKGATNVRAKPNSKSNRVGKVNNGETYPLLEADDSGWFKIRLNDGTEGYISGKKAKQTD